jgi:hypothetical protein
LVRVDVSHRIARTNVHAAVDAAEPSAGPAGSFFMDAITRWQELDCSAWYIHHHVDVATELNIILKLVRLIII